MLLEALIIATTTTAWVTRYNDSGVMASQRWTYIGAVACPRKYKLGVRVEIDGQEYVCEDRTHKRLNGRFDIYDSRDTKTLMKWGKQKKLVKIL